jgi:hypothetical protein
MYCILFELNLFESAFLQQRMQQRFPGTAKKKKITPEILCQSSRIPMLDAA